MDDVFTFRARLGAPPASVWRALTEGAALETWLAERAGVSIPEDRFVFWGRHTPQGKPGRQRLLAAAPDRLLRFTWELDGEKTTVEIRLEPDGAHGTLLTLTQTGVPSLEVLMAPAGRRDGLHSIHTFWPLAIANLANHMEGRELLPMCDFGDTHRDEACAELFIGAPPERVWASLIEPEEIDRWFGASAEVEPRVGGRINLVGGGKPGEILELEPGRKLVYGHQGTVVRWGLEEADGGTFLTLSNGGYSGDGPGSAAQHEAGWLGALAELKRIHELGPAYRSLTVEFSLPGM